MASGREGRSSSLRRQSSICRTVSGLSRSWTPIDSVSERGRPRLISALLVFSFDDMGEGVP